MKEFRDVIESQRKEKSAISKIRGRRDQIYFVGSGDLEDQRKRVLAFGDDLHSVKRLDKDYWTSKSEEQEKIPGMSQKDWKLQVWDTITPPEDPIFDKRLKVYGLTNGQFLINHYWIASPVIIFPNRFFLWNVTEPEEIKPHTLEIMNYVKPRPDYLIIGTGNEAYSFHHAFLAHFQSMGMKVDVLKTFEACSTFNSCIDDDLNVACALIPANV